MRELARFNGRNGGISIIEESATGARVHHEAGVQQSHVHAGGDDGVGHVAPAGGPRAGCSYR